MEILDEMMQRKLIKRRGQLHAFPNLDSTRAAVVLIDLTVGFMGSIKESESLISRVNTLTQAAANASIPIYWVYPASVMKWRTRENTLRLLGKAAGIDDPEMAKIDPRFTRYASDHLIEKTGYSAFYPGNCDLPALLHSIKRDQIILGGVLTDICVTSSARDAFEAGHQVLIAEDSCNANDDLLHQTALRTLARGFADVHSTEGVIHLIENST